MYTSTGKPRGRPKGREYLTLVVRVPKDLVESARRYAGLQGCTISQLLRQSLASQIAGEALATEQPMPLVESRASAPQDFPAFPRARSAATGVQRQEIVQQLILWQQQGLSLRAMAQQLHAAHVPTLTARGRWHQGTIGKLLRLRPHPSASAGAGSSDHSC